MKKTIIPIIFSLILALFAAAPAMATVYFQSDFNSGSTGAFKLDSNWQLMSSGGMDNSAAVRLTYAKAGTPGNQASINMSSFNTQEVWIDFDTKIDGTMNGGMKFVKIFGSNSVDSQNNSTFIMDYSSNVMNRVCYYMDTLCETPLSGSSTGGSSCTATPVTTTSSIDLRGGQWHHVKIHFVRAAAGTSTGEYQIWIDGTEKVHFTNVNNNSPASSATSSIASINFGDYTNSNNSTWYFWIDNLTVSSTDPGGSSSSSSGTTTGSTSGSTSGSTTTTDPTPTTSGSFAWSQPTYSTTEGDGTATFTITRSDASSAASVDWGTFQNTAIAGQDYQGVSWTTVNFAAGESSKNVSVQILDDSYAENDETFTVSLNNPVNATLGSLSSATVTIHDNDAVATPAPTSTFAWSSSSYSVDEGAGTASFTIVRSGDTTGTASVDYKTYQQTATADQDYIGLDWQTVTFGPGVTSKVVTVQILDDTLIEGDETFNLSLATPVNGSLGTPVDASVTILDNDSSTTTQKISPPRNLRWYLKTSRR